MAVHIHNALDARALGPEDVPVEGEAMAGLHGLDEAPAEAEHRILLVRVILLQDAAHAHHGMNVLVWLLPTHVV